MAINTTYITNATGNWVISMGTGINVNSGGVFGFFILLAFFIIPFMAGLRFGVRAASGTAAFSGAVAALFLRLIGWINDPMLFGSIVIVAVMVVVLFLSRE